MARLRSRLIRAAGPTFVSAGALHFVKPKVYASIMPDYLPAHRGLVYASGVAEAASCEAPASSSKKRR